MRPSNSTVSLNTYDILKLAALAVMTVDHLGEFLIHDDWLRVVGRMAAPAFCFLVGYNGSFRFRKELLIGAVIMSVVDALLTPDLLPLNILWPILIARFALQHLLEKPMSPLLICGVCLLWLPGTVVILDYGSLVLLWALWGQAVAKGNRRDSIYYMAAAVLGTVIYNFMGFDWTDTQYLAAGGIILGLAVMLQRFTLRPVGHSRALAFLSRHSLEYYVLHPAAMMVLGTFPA